MKELLTNLPMIDAERAMGFTLIDTCAFIHVFEHHEKIAMLKEALNRGRYGMTSFNVEELVHVDHKLSPDMKEQIRRFFKEKENLDIIDIRVHPGQWEMQKEYIRKIEPMLLQIDHNDISDAVLFATALKIKGNIITRDKHSLYNQLAEQFANRHSINISNKII